MPLSRHQPLRSNPDALRAWKKRSTPIRRGRKRDISADVRAQVAARSGGICEIRAACDGRRAVHVHHRRLRSQGGKHALENLLHVCAACHHYAHSHPALAYERGWLLRATEAQP